MADPTDDIIQDILPRGEVSIVAGASGAGKSTLVMQFLAAFQRKESHFLGYAFAKEINWGWLANDHAWKMYEGTAARCGLDFDKIPHVSLMDDDTLDLELFKVNPLRMLEDCLDKLVDQDCNAIVADTLVSWFGGDIRNYNIPAYALLRLGRYCRRRNVTLLGTHHATKARTDYGFKRPQDRISGSAALLGFSSTQLFLLPPDESGNPCYEFHIIAHNAPARMIALTRLGEAEGGVFVPFEGEREGKMNALEATIIELMTAAGDMSVTRNYLLAKLKAEGTDLSPSTLDRHLKTLVREGLITRARHGEYRRAAI